MTILAAPNRLLSYFLVLFFLLVFSQQKIYSNQFGIPNLRRQGCWLFLDRMHLEPGTLKIHFKLKLNANNYKQNSFYPFQLAAIPQSIWPISVANKCDREKFTQEQALQINRIEHAIHSDLSRQNSFNFETRSILQITQEQTYHFVLRHCSKNLLSEGYGRDVKLQIYGDFQNNDRYHSTTESSYGWLLPLLIILGIGLLKYLYKDKQQQGDNWIKWTLKISLWVSIVSIGFKYLGYVIYAYLTGSQYQFFDIVFLLLHSVSDSIIIIILLLLAYGWTVTFNNSMDFDLYVPLACMLGFVNVIMTMLNKITDGQHDKYHMFDTIPAYIMIGFRLLGFSIFLGGIVKVSLSIKSEDTNIRRYIRELGILGTIYLTFVPASMYLITFVDTKYRKQFLYFAIQSIRFGLNIWLVMLSGWKSSSYRRIIDKSFMQKGDKFY